MFHTTIYCTMIKLHNAAICFQFMVTAHMKNASAGCTFTIAKHSSRNGNINRITMKENISIAQNKKTDNETAYEERTVFALLFTFSFDCWFTTGLTAPQTLDTETTNPTTRVR